ncbi:MAG: CRISPR-associated helicase Cas3' [Isosphaeraceae bacterium]
MTTAPLLAKARPGQGREIRAEITLIGHAACVLAAVSALFGTPGNPTRLARSWLRFFGLVAEEFDRFLRHVIAAAVSHDWGKANDGFQDAVNGTGEQVVRHEHLSGLLLAEVLFEPTAKAWLTAAGIDETVILAAVLSHHVKVAPKGSSVNKHALGTLVGKRETLRFYPDHPDFEWVWHAFQAEVGSPCPSTIDFPTRWDKTTIRAKSEALSRSLDEAHREHRKDRPWWGFVAAVRSGLIVADAVGSAVVRFDLNDGQTAEVAIEAWVKDCFSTPLTGEDVWENVVTKRIDELRRKKKWDDQSGHEFGGVRGFTRFQCEVADQGPRVLLTAACGSGKTLAAWNWIKAQIDARPTDQPLSRALFLYPTRATATEGFRDYVSWAPEDEAGLLTGTSDYELQDMFSNPEDSNDPRKGQKYQSNARLFAIRHWPRRVFSATADQFFPFMQYGYGPLCLLPLLAESILVVDEVHSFDRSMFNTLCRFLKEFPEVPVLCMTATLSDERSNALIEYGLKPHTGQETPPDGGVTDSNYPRYRVKWVDRVEARRLASGALADWKRILWVSNRVDDCQSVYASFGDDGDALHDERTAFCYHSRFKLEDRKDRHQELIKAFQDAVKDGAGPRSLLGATTQVCEMSLDLDAQILVTELAPIASIIQRMGRCNRDSKRMRRPDHPIGRVYVLRPEPGKEKPYEKEELALAARFVDKLHGRDVSQAELESIYREIDPGTIEPTRYCPFLESGPYADGKEDTFRDIDEFTVPCVLESEVSRVVAAVRERKPIDGFIVPVPRRFALDRPTESSPLPRWLRVAETSRYDKLTGFDGRDRET